MSKQFHIGQRVRYSPTSGDPADGKITGRDKKDGMTIYDVKLDDGFNRSRWGYPEQFEPLPGATATDIIGADLVAALRQAGFKVVKK